MQSIPTNRQPRWRNPSLHPHVLRPQWLCDTPMPFWAPSNTQYTHTLDEYIYTHTVTVHHTLRQLAEGFCGLNCPESSNTPSRINWTSTFNSAPSLCSHILLFWMRVPGIWMWFSENVTTAATCCVSRRHRLTCRMVRSGAPGLNAIIHSTTKLALESLTFYSLFKIKIKLYVDKTIKLYWLKKEKINLTKINMNPIPK